MKFAQVCRLSAAIAASLLAANASAELNLNGFINVVGGSTVDGDQSMYGYDDSISFNPDTLVGLQAMADLGHGLSATAQLIARGQDNYEVEAEWAYLSYQATPNFRISAGRQRMPLYIYSDYLDVGYAYHWVSPPGSFYNPSVSAFDGISLNYGTYLGDLETGVQIVGGAASEDNVGQGQYSADVDDYVGVVGTIGYGPVTFRATYQQAQLTRKNANGGPTSWPPSFANIDSELANMLSTDDVDVTFAGVGLNVDYANVLFVTEARQQNYKDNVIPDERAYYASLGYRIGDFMPYIGFERTNSKTERDAYAQLASLAGGEPLVKALNASAADARIYTLGLQYNLHPAATLKVEYNKSNDLRDPEQLPEGSGGDVGLVRVAITAVF